MKNIFLTIFIVLFSQEAFAVDLSVNLDAPILTAEGKTRKECIDADTAAPTACKTFRDLTLRIVAMEALDANDQELRGDDRAKAGALAIKIAEPKEIILTLEDASLIKKQVNKFFDPVTVARVNAMLDPGAK